MLFSRDIYRVGVRAPQVFARKELGERFHKDWSLQFTGLFANAVDIANLPPVSPWHGIMTRPFKNENIFNYVNEIPLGMREKIEISTATAHNPLLQDRNKDGSLRKFTYGKIPFNYGCLPRTYEDPTKIDKHMKAEKVCGDGDPVDVVELSGSPLPVGGVSQVRVLGVLGMIDQGEADWKVLVADVDDPNIERLADVSSERIAEIVDWFRNYKTTDGKKKNEFAFGAAVQDADFAMEVIASTQAQYDALRSGAAKNSKGLWLPDPSNPPSGLSEA